MKKEKEGDLKDRSRRPRNCPCKTPEEIEDQVIKAKNKTRLGCKRLSRYLKKHQGLNVLYGTIRHILRRNKDKLTYQLKAKKRRKEKREFVD